jgi:hypothetical protein
LHVTLTQRHPLPVYGALPNAVGVLPLVLL